MDENTTRETERYYTKAAGTAYMLPCDEEERERLSIQHANDVRIFNNRLIVAPVKFEAGDRILESGAAAGAWMLDLASTIPETISIHGIDIESRLFPESKPDNVSFSVNSITKLPQEWTNTFTYVHQRLLIAGLRKLEWESAIKEIFRVLKPGGWVEFHEPSDHEVTDRDYWGLRLHSVKAMVFVLKDLEPSINDKLPSMLKNAGFVDVISKKRTFPLGKWGGENGERAVKFVGGFQRGLKKVALQYKLVSDSDEFDKYATEVEDWWDKKPGVNHVYFMHCARKPT